MRPGRWPDGAHSRPRSRGRCVRAVAAPTAPRSGVGRRRSRTQPGRSRLGMRRFHRGAAVRRGRVRRSGSRRRLRRRRSRSARRARDALLMPGCDARSASDGAAPRTAAVSGATVMREPEPEQHHARAARPCTYCGWAPSRSSSSSPDGGDDRADPHEQARPEAVGQRAEAPGQQEHEDRERQQSRGPPATAR